jgi:hypothetical protein
VAGCYCRERIHCEEVSQSLQLFTVSIITLTDRTLIANTIPLSNFSHHVAVTLPMPAYDFTQALPSHVGVVLVGVLQLVELLVVVHE